MRLIEIYIFRRIVVAFVSVLVVLTAIIWSTQALQRLDLVTAKGQTIGLFLGLSALAVPYLAALIAPIALVLAMVTIYDGLNRDNELAVMSASGASRLTMLRPAFAAALCVSALIALTSFWIAPLGLKQLRVLLTQVRADIIGSVVTPGNFMEVDEGLVVHIENRLPDGTLTGLLLADDRASDLSMTYFARTGRVLEAVDRTLLVLTDGTIQRLERDSGDLSVVDFEAYAFDLTNLIPQDVKPVFKASERTLPELLQPGADDPYAQERRMLFRIEINDRLTQPLYPVAFVLIAFLFVGDPQTTRRSRAAGVLASGLTVGAVRFAGYAASTIALGSPAAIALMYVAPLGTGALAFAIIVSDRRVTIHDRAGALCASAMVNLQALWRRPPAGKSTRAGT